ncbi:hypothetical protein CPLU01_09630 [Colletotrichum plurivorum]|uniref:SnoaL-like domain-containing protein n=1 Tax=Colletotrichum plurivorum TaxID=2175906 RepID=A0A8H6K865_9PEZI|nr:hypothetical protein CPLU01_09630 [Colletotrichum plurivorum]
MAAVSDHELIRNCIALCAIAYDSKDWQLLKSLLTEDCVFHYPEPLGPATGPEAIAGTLEKAISHLQTQHSLTTQLIELGSDDTATATTYSKAIHFLGDRHFFADGRYEDKLVKVECAGKHVWRIKERKAIVMGVPQGEWSLLG